MTDCRKTYNECKLKLTTGKGQLTKSLNKSEENCKALMKDLLNDDLPQSSKVRMAAGVIEKPSILSKKGKMLEKLERGGKIL